MKKYYFYSSIIFIILALIPVYLKECTPKYYYAKYFNLYNENADNMITTIHRFNDHYNIILKLLKSWPESLETFIALSYFKQPGSYRFAEDPKPSGTHEIRCKYSTLKQNFLTTLNEPNNNPAEKILLMHLILNDNQLYKKKEIYDCFDNLINMKNNCQDKRYSALATFELFRYHRKFQNEFIQQYPEHPYTPYVHLSIMQYEVYFQKKPFKDYEWLHQKYKNLKSPDGWSFSADLHAAYFQATKDRKMLSFLKTECPNYPMHKRKIKVFCPIDIEYDYAAYEMRFLYLHDPE